MIDQQPQNSQTQSDPWAYSAVSSEPPQCVRSPDEFRDKCLNGEYFKNQLKPSDVKLSSAMAMSAAAVSPNLGKRKAEEQRFTHILTLLGMEMAAHLVYNMTGERESGFCHRVRCCLYERLFSISKNLLTCYLSSIYTEPTSQKKVLNGTLTCFISQLTRFSLFFVNLYLG